MLDDKVGGWWLWGSGLAKGCLGTVPFSQEDVGAMLDDKVGGAAVGNGAADSQGSTVWGPGGCVVRLAHPLAPWMEWIFFLGGDEQTMCSPHFHCSPTLPLPSSAGAAGRDASACTAQGRALLLLPAQAAGTGAAGGGVSRAPPPWPTLQQRWMRSGGCRSTCGAGTCPAACGSREGVVGRRSSAEAAAAASAAPAAAPRGFLVESTGQGARVPSSAAALFSQGRASLGACVWACFTTL